MTKYKVGLVFDASLDVPDGVTQYVLITGRWLASQGHDVHYIVGETKRTDILNIHSMSRNVKVRFNQNRMVMPLPTSRKKIRALLEQEQFDVLHIQVPYSPAMAARVIAEASPKTAVVGMFHVAGESRTVRLANKFLGWYVRKSLRRFDAMLSNSTASQNFAKETWGVDSQIIPLPLELDRFYAGKPFPKYKDSLNVVFLGRFVERKGCQFLLQAVARLHDDKSWPTGARVILCGAGPLEASLRSYVKQKGLDKIVEFVGYISEEDKPKYLAGADVVVYPSTGGESFGIVLLEAMAASRGAVLGGDNPGYSSVMAPHPDSLFDPYDIENLAAKISDLLHNPKVRSDYHDWQRSYVERFSTDAVGKQLLEVYAQALHKRRS